MKRTFSLDHNTVIGNQAPFYFDNSVLDIYSTISNGGTLHVIPQMLYSFPIRLLEYIRDYRINTIFWVPTVLARVADLNLLDKCDIDCLEKVLFAGEVMPARQLNSWIRRLPNATFANLYGPTEITVDCTYYIVNRDIRDDESVPIGNACMNTDVPVLYDLIITSPDFILPIDVSVIHPTGVYMFCPVKTADTKKAEKFLNEMLTGWKLDGNAKIMTEKKNYLNRLASLKPVAEEDDDGSAPHVEKLLKSLSM